MRARTVSWRRIAACPYGILAAEHYLGYEERCGCYDPGSSSMREWGYAWSPKRGRWVAPTPGAMGDDVAEAERLAREEPLPPARRARLYQGIADRLRGVEGAEGIVSGAEGIAAEAQREIEEQG